MGELSGPAIKAANTRCGVPLVRDFCKEVFKTPDEVDTDVVAVLSELSDWYDILFEGGVFLEGSALERLRELTTSIGVRVLRLREWSRVNSKLYWSVKPKMHKMQHLPIYAELLSLRYLHVYMEESHMGTIARIYQAAMRGRYYDDIQSNVLLRRVLGLFLRMEA